MKKTATGDESKRDSGSGGQDKEKPAEKSSSADKTADSTVDKQGGKSVDKQGGKSVDKQGGKSTDKQTEKSTDKTADKQSGRSASARGQEPSEEDRVSSALDDINKNIRKNMTSFTDKEAGGRRRSRTFTCDYLCYARCDNKPNENEKLSKELQQLGTILNEEKGGRNCAPPVKTDGGTAGAASGAPKSASVPDSPSGKQASQAASRPAPADKAANGTTAGAAAQSTASGRTTIKGEDGTIRDETIGGGGRPAASSRGKLSSEEGVLIGLTDAMASGKTASRSTESRASKSTESRASKSTESRASGADRRQPSIAAGVDKEPSPQQDEPVGGLEAGKQGKILGGPAPGRGIAKALLAVEGPSAATSEQLSSRYETIAANDRPSGQSIFVEPQLLIEEEALIEKEADAESAKSGKSDEGDARGSNQMRVVKIGPVVGAGLRGEGGMSIQATAECATEGGATEKGQPPEEDAVVLSLQPKPANSEQLVASDEFSLRANSTPVQQSARPSDREHSTIQVGLPVAAIKSTGRASQIARKESKKRGGASASTRGGASTGAMGMTSTEIENMVNQPEYSIAEGTMRVCQNCGAFNFSSARPDGEFVAEEPAATGTEEGQQRTIERKVETIETTAGDVDVPADETVVEKTDTIPEAADRQSVLPTERNKSTPAIIDSNEQAPGHSSRRLRPSSSVSSFSLPSSGLAAAQAPAAAARGAATSWRASSDSESSSSSSESNTSSSTGFGMRISSAYTESESTGSIIPIGSYRGTPLAQATEPVSPEPAGGRKKTVLLGDARVEENWPERESEPVELNITSVDNPVCNIFIAIPNTDNEQSTPLRPVIRYSAGPSSAAAGSSQSARLSSGTVEKVQTVPVVSAGTGGAASEGAGTQPLHERNSLIGSVKSMFSSMVSRKKGTGQSSAQSGDQSSTLPSAQSSTLPSTQSAADTEQLVEHADLPPVDQTIEMFEHLGEWHDDQSM